MGTEEEKICGCLVATLTNVIAWLQIILSTLGAITFIVLAIGLAKTDISIDVAPENDMSKLLLIVLVGLAIAHIINVILGIFLFNGNRKKEAGSLRTWIVATATSVALSVLLDVIAFAAGDATKMGHAFLTLAIGGFMMYVVHRRRCEITSFTVME